MQSNSYLNNLSPNNFINILLISLPISYILGNLAINVNLACIIFFTLIIYRKKIFKYKLLLIDKLFLIFFSFALFSGIINTFSSLSNLDNQLSNYNVLLKSLAFMRYLIFYFIIRFLVLDKIFNFKLFFIITSICVLFVSIDIIIQFYYGKDLFGNLRTPHKLSGPFGDEYIAGSYLQRFSIFLFFLVPFFFNLDDKKIIIFILSILFMLIFLSMIMAGNRMPILLFLLMFVLLFFMEKKLRKYSLLFFTVSILIFLLFFNYSLLVKSYTANFLDIVYQMVLFLKDVIFLGKEPSIYNTISNSYIKEFYTGYAAWRENILVGGGIDSFYYNCAKTMQFCSSHPHNYYLELLSELGLVGFLLALIILTYILYLLITSKRQFVSGNFTNNLISPFILVFLVEIFPIKTSGSFFTTGNATFIFLILGIIIGLNSNRQSN